MPKKSPSVLLLLGRYNPAFHRGIARYAGAHRWHLCIDMADRGIIPHGWRGDGILTTLGNRPELLRFIRKAALPTVDLIAQRPDVPLPRVVGDNVMIGRIGAEHFLDRGFRHFAWYSELFTNVERLRLQGFEERLSDEGLRVSRLIWCRSASGKRKTGWHAQRLWLGRELAKQPEPLAVLTFSDYDASAVMDACALQGLRIPDDVAVLGVNNSELVCDFLPVPLSSINHDLERIGYEGAALLDQLMAGKPPPVNPVLIEPRGVTLRQSTDILAVSQPAVRAALRFFQENHGLSIGIPEAAQAAGVTRHVLDKLFRQHLNRTVHDELLRIRLQHACSLLQQPGPSASAIARLTGFCHPSHLTNTFHKLMGLTPRQYRLKHIAPAGAPGSSVEDTHLNPNLNPNLNLNLQKNGLRLRARL
jgi:LacI family transcriptional regulator